jgi:hypothetical protein
MTEEMKGKRESLKLLSIIAQAMIEAGEVESINDGLCEIYSRQGHSEIHSFKKWMELGQVVKRGEKALLLWGQPRTAAKNGAGRV